MQTRLPKQKNRDGICNSKLNLQGSVLNYVSCHTLKSSIASHQARTPQGSVSQRFPGFQPQVDFQTAVLLIVLENTGSER